MYRLPDAVDSRNDLELRPVTLRELAERAAYKPGFLTADDLHGFRERLKKGTAVYTDRGWRCLVMASRTGAVESDFGRGGLVFTVLREAGTSHEILIQAISDVASRQGLTGWLVSNHGLPSLRAETGA